MKKNINTAWGCLPPYLRDVQLWYVSFDESIFAHVFADSHKWLVVNSVLSFNNDFLLTIIWLRPYLCGVEDLIVVSLTDSTTWATGLYISSWVTVGLIGASSMNVLLVLPFYIRWRAMSGKVCSFFILLIFFVWKSLCNVQILEYCFISYTCFKLSHNQLVLT